VDKQSSSSKRTRASRFKLGPNVSPRAFHLSFSCPGLGKQSTVSNPESRPDLLKKKAQRPVVPVRYFLKNNQLRPASTSWQQEDYQEQQSTAAAPTALREVETAAPTHKQCL